MPVLFGVRHLSPNGAHQLVRLLNERQPQLILVEGPSDLSGLMPDLCDERTVPPVAMLAFSSSVPVRSILYPLAVYSAEYQAILWAHRNQKECRFCDLPFETFLAFAENHVQRQLAQLQQDEESSGQQAAEEEQNTTCTVYQKLAEQTGEHDQETYWERRFEHNTQPNAYHLGAAEYGRQLRATTLHTRYEAAENLLREGYMKRQIADALASGIPDDQIVVVTGAYHVAGLESCAPLTDAELAALPRLEGHATLMPYSYYRLTSLSGYGAGNSAPAYYELLWDALQAGDLSDTGYRYLSSLAARQRARGLLSSSAEVIEAVRLANTLAQLRGSKTPVLQDLRDAATACLGQGALSTLSLSLAELEVGSRIGTLPPGVSQTSIQQDFYRQLEQLKLDSYKSLVEKKLELDLRENLRVKSRKSAFLDLERSFFLHRLQVLKVTFGQKLETRQEKATWAENWQLRWTPEAEIQIVEAALKGETVELAAAFCFKEQLEAVQSIREVADVLEKACLCGMPQTVGYATGLLQGMITDADSITEITATAFRLSNVIRYGDIRRLDAAPLLPILQQLFLHACLLLPDCCDYNPKDVDFVVIGSMNLMNLVALNHDCVDEQRWLSVLRELSSRDDLNTKASGFATAILLERGQIDSERLSVEVQRRLSPGTPADLGAAWFEGLALKNRYALIARLELWERLSDYIDTLDDKEFKRALVFLRRAFANFSANERTDIAENLGEIWGLNPMQVSEVLNAALTTEEQSALEGFDFDDF